jgi:putative alpha-1,2-mannosidase
MTLKHNYFLLLLLVFLNSNIYTQNILDYVDLFICTEGDHGQLDPSATVPFGMVKLGPDTDPVNHSGYRYNSNKLLGFSHNRIGGVGCRGAGGNLRILPLVNRSSKLSQNIDKSTEKAEPNYYKVQFSNGIKAELTTTNRTGIHKYSFPKTDSSFISLDFGSSFVKVYNCSADILNQQEIDVTVSAENVCNKGRYTVYYHLWSSKKLSKLIQNKNQLLFNVEAPDNEAVELYVTASTISTSDAKNEWESVSSKLSFEKALKEGQKKWTDLLSRIEVEGKEEYKTLFYTHLYHIFLNPVQTENSYQQYKGTNGNLYIAEDYTRYDGWSMWDNFRNKFSMYALIAPEVAEDISHSLVDLFEHGKPTWSSYYEPVPTARTEHSIVTLLDFYQRGIDDFDVHRLYGKLVAELDNISEISPGEKLEKSYDFWALSEFARILGKQDDQQVFLSKAMEYKNTWKKVFSVIDDESDIMHAKGLYEGTVWQYRWHVQFDIEGMIDLFGGREEYTEQLEYFFDNNLYNHGNQPDIHVPFLFNYSTKPWLTQKWVNKILTKDMYQYYGTHKKWTEPYYGRIYKAEPKGYIPEMDDDEGTMSGWYVMSALGMYPVTVGKPEFQLSAPIFDRVVLHLAEGKTFEIITKNLSEDHYHIDSVSFNNQAFTQSYIKHNDIINGGKLIFYLADKPNENWGILQD